MRNKDGKSDEQMWKKLFVQHSTGYNQHQPTKTGWWLGKVGLFFHIIGNFITPTD
jgi:hypothetical protein